MVSGNKTANPIESQASSTMSVILPPQPPAIIIGTVATLGYAAPAADIFALFAALWNDPKEGCR